MPFSPAFVLVLGAGALVGRALDACIRRLPRTASPAVSGVRRRNWSPVVGAATAGWFVLVWWHYDFSVLMLSRLLLGCALIVLFAVDLEHRVLPNVVTVPGIVVGLAFGVATEPGWLSSILGVVVGGGVLLAVSEAYYRLRHEEALGMGDVKMLAMIGAFIGWKLAVVALMLASLGGSAVGLALVATRRAGLKDALPFGTFLAVGAAIAATAGPRILQWYLGWY